MWMNASKSYYVVSLYNLTDIALQTNNWQMQAHVSLLSLSKEQGDHVWALRVEQIVVGPRSCQPGAVCNILCRKIVTRWIRQSIAGLCTECNQEEDGWGTGGPHQMCLLDPAGIWYWACNFIILCTSTISFVTLTMISHSSRWYETMLQWDSAPRGQYVQLSIVQTAGLKPKTCFEDKWSDPYLVVHNTMSLHNTHILLHMHDIPYEQHQ